jgi:hypothetical protein
VPACACEQARPFRVRADSDDSIMAFGDYSSNALRTVLEGSWIRRTMVVHCLKLWSREARYSRSEVPNHPPPTGQIAVTFQPPERIAWRAWCGSTCSRLDLVARRSVSSPCPEKFYCRLHEIPKVGVYFWRRISEGSELFLGKVCARDECCRNLVHYLPNVRTFKKSGGAT